MAKSNARRNDDDDEDAPLGDWALAVFYVRWSVSVSFVVAKDGRPQADYWPTSQPREAFRWKSYHAARKFQRSHPHLRGYVIVNLSEWERQSEENRRIDDEWVNGDKSKELRS